MEAASSTFRQASGTGSMNKGKVVSAVGKAQVAKAKEASPDADSPSTPRLQQQEGVLSAVEEGSNEDAETGAGAEDAHAESGAPPAPSTRVEAVGETGDGEAALPSVPKEQADARKKERVRQRTAELKYVHHVLSQRFRELADCVAALRKHTFAVKKGLGPALAALFSYAEYQKRRQELRDRAGVVDEDATETDPTTGTPAKVSFSAGSSAAGTTRSAAISSTTRPSKRATSFILQSRPPAAPGPVSSVVWRDLPILPFAQCQEMLATETCASKSGFVADYMKSVLSEKERREAWDAGCRTASLEELVLLCLSARTQPLPSFQDWVGRVRKVAAKNNQDGVRMAQEIDQFALPVSLLASSKNLPVDAAAASFATATSSKFSLRAFTEVATVKKWASLQSVFDARAVKLQQQNESLLQEALRQRREEDERREQLLLQEARKIVAAETQKQARMRELLVEEKRKEHRQKAEEQRLANLDEHRLEEEERIFAEREELQRQAAAAEMDTHRMQLEQQKIAEDLRRLEEERIRKTEQAFVEDERRQKIFELKRLEDRKKLAGEKQIEEARLKRAEEEKRVQEERERVLHLRKVAFEREKLIVEEARLKRAKMRDKNFAADLARETKRQQELATQKETILDEKRALERFLTTDDIAKLEHERVTLLEGQHQNERERQQQAVAEVLSEQTLQAVQKQHETEMLRVQGREVENRLVNFVAEFVLEQVRGQDFSPGGDAMLPFTPFATVGLYDKVGAEIYSANAKNSGVKEGDRILSVNGVAIESWAKEVRSESGRTQDFAAILAHIAAKKMSSSEDRREITISCGRWIFLQSENFFFDFDVVGGNEKAGFSKLGKLPGLAFVKRVVNSEAGSAGNADNTSTVTSAAARAGLRVGDRITHLNGIPVSISTSNNTSDEKDESSQIKQKTAMTEDEYREMLTSARPLKISVARAVAEGDMRENLFLEVKVQERDAEGSSGIKGSGFKKQGKLPGSLVYVKSLGEQSVAVLAGGEKMNTSPLAAAARAAGVQVGDRILKVNGRKPSTLTEDQFRRVILSERPLTILCGRRIDDLSEEAAEAQKSASSDDSNESFDLDLDREIETEKKPKKGKTVRTLTVSLGPAVPGTTASNPKNKVGIAKAGIIPGLAVVRRVTPDSEAVAAGARVGDQIIAVNGIPLMETTEDELREEFQKRPVNVLLARRIEVGENGAAREDENEKKLPLLEFEVALPDAAAKLGIKKDTLLPASVVGISQVTAGARVGAKVGLRVGDRVLGVGGAGVASMDEDTFTKALAGVRPLTVRIGRELRIPRTGRGGGGVEGGKFCLHLRLDEVPAGVESLGLQLLGATSGAIFVSRVSGLARDQGIQVGDQLIKANALDALVLGAGKKAVSSTNAATRNIKEELRKRPTTALFRRYYGLVPPADRSSSYLGPGPESRDEVENSIPPYPEPTQLVIIACDTDQDKVGLSKLGILVPPQRDDEGGDGSAVCVVKRVVPGSKAQLAGVRVGDRILSVNGSAVEKLGENEYERLLKSVRPLTVVIARNLDFGWRLLPVNGRQFLDEVGAEDSVKYLGENEV